MIRNETSLQLVKGTHPVDSIVESLPILTVTVASKPQLQSSRSVRSSSVSHENSSDYASDLSSAVSPAGYETPPSRISTPVILPDIDPDMIFPARPTPTVPSTLTSRQLDAQGPAQNLPPWHSMSPPSPGHDDTPYIRFALEQITFDEEVVGARRTTHLENDFGVPRTIRAEELARIQEPAVPRSSDSPSRPPQPFRFPSSSFDRNRELPRDQLLMPATPPEAGWPKTGFVPLALRFSMLLSLVFLCLLMIAGIMFSNIYGLRHSGLYDYDGDATPRYFVFQYLPQMLGAVILLWLHVVQAAVYRVLPYFCLSAESSRKWALSKTPVLSANFVLPDYRFFAVGEPLIGVTLLVFWLMNFTIPFLSCLYQTQYYSELARFKWTTVQGLGWVLVAWYFMLISALLYCCVRFRSRRSALMWDPCSIADTIILFQQSNVLTDYARSEVAPDMRAIIPPRILRLGFWTPSGSSDVYYTVGQHSGPLNRLSAFQDAPAEQPTTQYRSDSSSTSYDIERHRYSNGSEFTRNIHSPYQRYRWCPWFLRDSCVLAWIIAANLLLIAFLVISFVNRAVQDGFDPLLPSTTHSDGFSPSNFLYSFLPSILATWTFLFWQPIDVFFRALQPYANLASPDGATAARSLLQSYSAMPPIVLTARALLNQDYKLAYITFVSLLSVLIPILAGGVFTAQQFASGDVRIVASMPGYIALCVFVCISALSFLVIWPTRKRYLPHSIDTIAGQLSFLYASHLLNDTAIRHVKTKAGLISQLSGEGDRFSNDTNEKALTGDGRRRLRERRNYFADREPRFAFGIFMGRDGKEHLGIDRLQRPGSGEMLVTTGTLKPSRSLRSNKARSNGRPEF